MSTSIESTKHTLERLLRLEMAAKNSYDGAIERIDTPDQQGFLDDLRRDHELAVGRIRNMLARLHDVDGMPGLQVVGTLVRGASGALTLLGVPALLRALRSAERALLGRLEKNGDDERLAPEARELIEDLRPRARNHVVALDQLLATVT
ncbi:MAG TPA: hypothetical protein VG755_36065 [Nannocystaceae bacterium]|nr:hypothetical protein [Nannocystaceae bacterium]